MSALLKNPKIPKLFTKLSVATVKTAFSLVVLFKIDSAQALAAKFNIDPSASFISSYTFSPDSVFFSLTDLGINSGDTIKLERFGSFSPFGDPTDEYFGAMWATFSADNTLLPNIGEYNGATTDRVPGAINATLPNGCLPLQCLDNSIFYISRVDFNGVIVQVPSDAKFIFIGAADSSFSDNVDLNQDFAVSINSVSTASVPEPSFMSGLLVFGVYITGLQFLRNRKKALS
ncbi:PEP-CTERM sorting domain-containing protein [Nostoc sp. DSM 114167]